MDHGICRHGTFFVREDFLSRTETADKSDSVNVSNLLQVLCTQAKTMLE